MAVTALDMITDALQGIQVYAAGETVSAADADLALKRLNVMMDQWSNESLMSYANLEQNATLIPGQFSYTIGPGGNFNMLRPIRILDSPGTAYVVDPNGNRYNLEVVQQDQWNLIWNIIETSSNYPNTLFYDAQMPLGIINVFPVPTIGYQLFWDSRIQLSEFPALNTVLTLPPGYQAAIQDNLAVELWRFFKPSGLPIPQDTKAIAARSKGVIKRSNTRPTRLYYDPEIVGKAQGSYNIYSDSSRAGGVQ